MTHIQHIKRKYNILKLTKNCLFLKISTVFIVFLECLLFIKNELKDEYVRLIFPVCFITFMCPLCGFVLELINIS